MEKVLVRFAYALLLTLPLVTLPSMSKSTFSKKTKKGDRLSAQEHGEINQFQRELIGFTRTKQQLEHEANGIALNIIKGGTRIAAAWKLVERCDNAGIALNESTLKKMDTFFGTKILSFQKEINESHTILEQLQKKGTSPKVLRVVQTTMNKAYEQLNHLARAQNIINQNSCSAQNFPRPSPLNLDEEELQHLLPSFLQDSPRSQAFSESTTQEE